jgi:biotin synthase
MPTLIAPALRHDWTLDEIEALYTTPLVELVFQAQRIHREHHHPHEVQGCMLLSIKTGGCPEDCAYCPQSAHYHTEVTREELLGVETVLDAAQRARANGATRFCMGAAWRSVPKGEPFERVLAMVRGVRKLGLEACCTLGMLTGEQADALADAGLTAYNHNLDTSPEFYGEIITTRTYQERLDTLAHVRRAGITVCCGGIIGMGETRSARYGLLEQLASLDPHPESVPINMLVRVPGTPLAGQPATDPLELVRTIAAARILMPLSKVRLSAGRLSLSDEAQALCFLAGANSVFLGDKLLTTPNPAPDTDTQLFERLGLRLVSSD